MKWSRVKKILNPPHVNGIDKIDRTIAEGMSLRQKRKEQEDRFIEELRELERGVTDANSGH